MNATIAGALIGGATNYFFDRKGDDIVDYCKNKVSIIRNINGTSVIDENVCLSDYEVGFIMKDNKFYPLKWGEYVKTEETIKVEEPTKEEPTKEEQKEQKEETKMIDDYITLEMMANISAISFLLYSTYKILSLLDDI